MTTDSLELSGPAECGPDVRCATLQYAIDQGYLTVPIYLQTEPVDLKVSKAPALVGPLHSPRSRKHKPMIVLTYCPFCSYPFAGVPAPTPTVERRLTEAEVSALSVEPASSTQPATTGADSTARWGVEGPEVLDFAEWQKAQPPGEGE